MEAINELILRPAHIDSGKRFFASLPWDYSGRRQDAGILREPNSDAGDAKVDRVLNILCRNGHGRARLLNNL